MERKITRHCYPIILLHHTGNPMLRYRQNVFGGLLKEAMGAIPVDNRVHGVPNGNTYANLRPPHQFKTSSIHPVVQIPPPYVPMQQAMVSDGNMPMIPNQQLGTFGSLPMGMVGYEVPLEVQQLPRGTVGYHGNNLKCHDNAPQMVNPTEASWLPNASFDHGQNFNVSEVPLNSSRISSPSIYDPVYEGLGLHIDPFIRIYTHNNNNEIGDGNDTDTPSQGQEDPSHEPPPEEPLPVDDNFMEVRVLAANTMHASKNFVIRIQCIESHTNYIKKISDDPDRIW
ncbi:hypothetical protein HHK36_004062 [Tetracentron sinense]|uniref:Uncharacterized protein n=1 Tax=Tetracentron sinense TaxID=13715 RepID=A0A834ZTK1_TETSI|nr:hypothetical protein HHK36_004062 [Tetracentron sinense]